MNCPSVCFHDGKEWSIDNCRFFFLTEKNKYQKRFLDERIIGCGIDDFDTPEQRFSQNSKKIIDAIKYNCVTQASIEGYSYGSSGVVFQIGENTGILKGKLYDLKIPFEIYPPTTIKKFASGSGKADKSQMYDAFFKETSLDLKKALSYDSLNVGSPIGDIVDSFYLCKYLFQKLK